MHIAWREGFESCPHTPALLTPIVDRHYMFPAAADEHHRGQHAEQHDRQKHEAFRDQDRQRAGQHLAEQSAGGGEHVECAVEAALPFIRHIALGGGDPDRIAGNAADTHDKAHHHHDRDRREQVDALQNGDDHIDGEGDGEAELCRDIQPIMDHPADGPAHQRHAPDQHIQVFSVFIYRLEPGEHDHRGHPAADGGEEEIDGDGQQSFFSHEVGKALPNVRKDLPGSAELALFRLLLGLEIVFIGPDARFHDRGDEKAQGVDPQQRRQPDLPVQKGGQGNHHRGEGLQHTGDGIRLLEVPLRDQQRIKALIGNHIHALDAAEDEAVHRKHGKGKPARCQQQRHQRIQGRRDEVQGIDGLFSGKPVQDGPGYDGDEQLRQRIHGDVDGIQQRGLGNIQHHQAHGKAGQRVSQHGNDAAQCDDGKVPRPERGCCFLFGSHVPHPYLVQSRIHCTMPGANNQCQDPAGLTGFKNRWASSRFFLRAGHFATIMTIW